jgi:hypothetical protein
VVWWPASVEMCGSAADVDAALHIREADAGIVGDARDHANLAAVGTMNGVTRRRTMVEVDDAQRAWGIGAAGIHPLDQFLAGVAPLLEVHRKHQDTRRRGNRRPGLDLGAHTGPAGTDTGEFVFAGRRLDGGLLERRLGVDPDLEPIDPSQQCRAEPGIGVEHEHVIGSPAQTGQRVDLPRRVEHQRPARRPHAKITDLLGDLRLEIGLSIGAGDRDHVTGSLVDESGGQGHGVVGVHTASLPWHTANDMSDDDAIFPDSIDGPDDDRSQLDELAERAVDVLLGLLRRANALAGGVLIFAFFACLGSFFLGLAALDDGARSAWLLLGGVGVIAGIGSVLLAMWRLWMVRRGSDALTGEIRRFIGRDGAAERTVLETVEVSEVSADESIVQVSRQFSSMRDGVDQQETSFPELSMALRSLTTLPGLMALAVVSGFAFAMVSPIFLLILIF